MNPNNQHVPDNFGTNYSITYTGNVVTYMQRVRNANADNRAFNQTKNMMERRAISGGGLHKFNSVFVGDKFENRLSRNDILTGSLDEIAYYESYDRFATIATSLFLGFLPGTSYSNISNYAFKNKYIGASSKLFGYKPIGGVSGTLNQGAIRIGWNSHGANYVFRGAIGHNPNFFQPTTIFGNTIHWHTPSLFTVPKIGL